jgi:hypothetical protein
MKAMLQNLRPKFSRWCGAAGFIVAGMFLLGRIVAGQFRGAPQFDEHGMEPYSAVETFRLRKMPDAFEVGLFGSSVAIWGLIPEIVAEGLGERPENLRKLSVAGGTSFDMRNLVKRNEGNFDHMRVALVELNPRILAAGLEDDVRLKIDLAQHASLSERLLLKDGDARRPQVAEWFLPLLSARRPLSTAFLNVTNPDPGSAMIPYIDRTLYPVNDWHVPDPARAVFKPKHEMSPDEVARRITSHWKPSRLLDQALREFLARLKEKSVTVILHQMPVHPDVVKAMQANSGYAESYADYLKYIGSLGLEENHFIHTLSVTELGIPVNGLRDHTHLNEMGAEIYSRFLGERTREILLARSPGR